MTGRMGRTRRRLRYLWCDLDPAGVELLSAALSATFAVLLLYRPAGATPLEHARAYAALCAVAAANKALGVLLEWPACRLVGSLLGSVFWVTLSFVLVRGNSTSIAWLCFLVLALAQMWAFKRNVRP